MNPIMKSTKSNFIKKIIIKERDRERERERERESEIKHLSDPKTLSP